jgi:hypothetical protein
MEIKKEIKSEKELIEILEKIPFRDEEHKKQIICSLIGCSKICTTCIGYRYCSRCGRQLGDSLGSIDYGIKEAVIIGHNCKVCKKNYKKCTWKDKYLVQNPFKEKK